MTNRYGEPPWGVVEDLVHWVIYLIDSNGYQVMRESTTPETVFQKRAQYAEYVLKINALEPIKARRTSAQILKLL